MERLLNLGEMASRLNRSPKTLRKHVDEQGIPHSRLGNRFLFDPDEVLAYIKNYKPEQRVSVKRKRNAPRGRFADALGL